MVNTCPSCGVLYNVASKDVGRRLKCKKCSASLKVTDAGLEMDSGGPPPVEESRPVAERNANADRDDSDFDEEPRAKKKRYRVPGPNPLELVGGIPTVLFGFGVFLVIVFISLPIIGRAGSDRAVAYTQRLENDREREKLELKPKKPPSDWTEAERKKVDDETPKIEAKYARLIEEARLDAQRTSISNTRDHWMESYGVMFGFLFLSFGCIGYLRTEQPFILRIVSAVILTLTMLMLLIRFSAR